jgi:hypothetical protein
MKLDIALIPYGSIAGTIPAILPYLAESANGYTAQSVMYQRFFEQGLL